CESGTWRGRRIIWGGRGQVRAALWMGPLVAGQHNPIIRAFSARLLAAHKPKKLALTACMRKLLTILNAMLAHRSPWQPARQPAPPCRSRLLLFERVLGRRVGLGGAGAGPLRGEAQPAHPLPAP